MRTHHLSFIGYSGRRCGWSVIYVAAALLLVTTSCKKSGGDACEKACAHATEVVLDMVASQGTLNSQALSERSAEMQLSCQLECREGGLDPECVLNAASYNALQNCSSEAPPEKEAVKSPSSLKVPEATPTGKTTESEASGEAPKSDVSPQPVAVEKVAAPGDEVAKPVPPPPATPTDTSGAQPEP